METSELCISQSIDLVTIGGEMWTTEILADEISHDLVQVLWVSRFANLFNKKIKMLCEFVPNCYASLFSKKIKMSIYMIDI